MEVRVRLCDKRRRVKGECLTILEHCCQRMNECATCFTEYARSTRLCVRQLQKMGGGLASLMLQRIRACRLEKLAAFQASVTSYNHASQKYQIAMHDLDALQRIAPATPVELPDEIVAMILIFAGNMKANAVCRQWRHVMRTSPPLIRLRRQEGYLSRA